MATQLFSGPVKWSLQRDAEGNRVYKVTHLVRGDDTPGIQDGPFNALTTPGLPLPGSTWIFGNDLDLWAHCTGDADVKPVFDKERNKYFEVEQTFTTKKQVRCNDIPIEDPLMEPIKVSGSFVKYTEEATYDRFGSRILNSAHEQVRGSQIEFDMNRPQVKIEQNVPVLNIGLCALMIDTVNQFPLWGLFPRMIKLSDFQWERKYHGLCYIYYTRSFTFDINYKTFDKRLLDEGKKVLNGHWDTTDALGTAAGTSLWILDNINGETPDADNPQHFIRAKDRNGENITITLDGQGRPTTNLGITITSITIGPDLITGIVKTSIAHGLSAGDTVNIVGAQPPYWDREYTVGNVLTSTEFDIAEPIDNPDPTTVGGVLYVKSAGPGAINVEKYPESDFLLLGVPTIL